MGWLKRNLGLVISGVVALGLLGLAGWYLWGKMGEEAAVSEQLDQQTAKFKEILSRPVTPGSGPTNNIMRAKEENKKLQEFAGELRRHLAPPELPKDLNNREFRVLLDNTVAGLQKEAETLGIGLPGKDYWFTFQAQKQMVEFKPLEALAAQAVDIREICEILFKARVHSLGGLKRVAMASEDTGATDYLTERKATTNDVTIITPYEVTFQGFSTELARVMEGFVGAERCFIVKTVGVDKAPAPPAAAGSAAPARFEPTPQQLMMNRYGLGGRPVAPPAGAAPAPRAANKGPVSALDENKLKFTLQVDSVRLKSTNKK